MAKHAIAGTCDGHPGTVAGIRDKNPDQSKARCGLLELGVRRSFGDGECDGGDEFAGLQSGCVHALKEVSRFDGALIGMDDGIQCQNGAGVAGRRIVVGDRATDGAHGTNLSVAYAAGQCCDCGDQELAILRAQVPQASPTLAEQVAQFVSRLRHQPFSNAFQRGPGIAESVEWAKALVALGTLQLDPEVIHDTAGILFKQREDIAALQPLISDLLAPEAAI